MRYELKLHRLTFGILVIVLMAFVALLIALHPIFADERLGVITSFTIIVLAATAFGYMGVVEGIIAFQFGRKHKRELLSYLTLGLFSLGCGLYLAISDSASIQTVALVAAPHAFLFGLAEIRLAQHLERHPVHKQSLIRGGIIEMILGVTLIVGYRLPTEGTVTLLAYVAIMSILQLAPLVFYRYRHLSRADRQTPWLNMDN